MAETNEVASQADLFDEAAARRALDLVQVDPAAAQHWFHEVLRIQAASSSMRALALLGLARLAYHRGEIDEASIAFKEAEQHALDTPEGLLVTEIRVSWALALQASGESAAALEQIALAVPHLEGAALGRALTQRGLVHATAGRRDEALRDYDAGLPLLLDGDEAAAMRTFANRGVVLTHLGEYERAERDFKSMHSIALRLQQHAVAAGALHNLAYLHGRSGQFVAALAGFSDARRAYGAIGSLDRHLRDLDLDEGEVLLELGLGVDALPLAERVVAATRSSGNAAQLAEGLLMLARACSVTGDAGRAVAAATEALQLFEAGGRDAWAAQARYWAIVSAESDEVRSRHSVLRQFVRLRRQADELERYGWLSEAAEVRVLTGRLALAAGRSDIASAVLHQASAAQRHPLARVRIGALHAAALLHIAHGDEAAAGSALRAGLRAVEQHRASLGTAELRSATGRLGAPLAAEGLSLALHRSQPAGIFEWAERGRAGALGAPPSTAEEVVPAELRSELRAARQRLTDAIASGEDMPADLPSDVATLESELSRLSRHRGATGERTATFRASELRDALGDTTLVEFLESDGLLRAVVCRARRLRLVTIGAVEPLVAANDHLAFALRRLAAIPHGPAAERASIGFDIARRELGRELFGPLERLLGDGPLVVVPTGVLHDVVWGALPAAERPGGLAVAPSAAWWSRGEPSHRRRKVLLVAGPQLRHADAEIAALHRIYPKATVLTGADATVDAVLDEMAGSTLVHIAAHGVFRTDNPLFSTLQLHDGPMFVHELEALARVPDSVVLAACSSGRSGVLPGDELLGTSAVLMGLGVRTVIAPMLPVADMVTSDVAVALHTGLRRNTAPAAIAAVLRQALHERRYDLVAAAASFTCLAGRGS